MVFHDPVLPSRFGFFFLVVKEVVSVLLNNSICITFIALLRCLYYKMVLFWKVYLSVTIEKNITEKYYSDKMTTAVGIFALLNKHTHTEMNYRYEAWICIQISIYTLIYKRGPMFFSYFFLLVVGKSIVLLLEEWWELERALYATLTTKNGEVFITAMLPCF